jgi:phosphoadenosine phosphosulfate reductase
MESDLETKVRIAKAVIAKTLPAFRTAIAWSGGKDSTAMLHMIMGVCDSFNYRYPDILFIDHNEHFDEIVQMVERFVEDNGLYMVVSRNREILDDLPRNIDDMDSKNRKNLTQTGFSTPNLDLTLNSFEGNHLLKTVPLINTISERGYTGIYTGIRASENPARAKEVFISPRKNPDHVRIHPMLAFTEDDIWAYIRKNRINVPSLYEKGYRSIDGRNTTFRLSSDPAWLQDRAIPERAGRAQDKEHLMEKLRRWGYL